MEGGTFHAVVRLVHKGGLLSAVRFWLWRRYWGEDASGQGHGLSMLLFRSFQKNQKKKKEGKSKK
jgi:hypothetical protein